MVRSRAELSLGETHQFETFDELEDLLRGAGDVLFEDDDFLLTLIGDYGYASARPDAKDVGVEEATRVLEHPQAQKPAGLWLWTHAGDSPRSARNLGTARGRRVYQRAGQAGVEGRISLIAPIRLMISSLRGKSCTSTAFTTRRITLVEPRVTRRLLDQIRPGLSFDLHESAGMDDRYWLSARKLPDEGQVWEERAATAIIGNIADSGAKLATEADAPSAWLDMSEQAVFWLDATRRGEGFNPWTLLARVWHGVRDGDGDVRHVRRARRYGVDHSNGYRRIRVRRAPPVDLQEGERWSYLSK